MKNLIIFLLFPFLSQAQTWVVHNDSLFYKVSGDSIYYNASPIQKTLWLNIKNAPTTLAGYGITNAASTSDLSGYSTTSHTHAFSSITSPPTTLSGYGITNGVVSTITVNGHALSGNVSVTASDLSLGNVTNTSDANKPVSTAQQTALDLKANLASPTFTGTVAGITGTMVGLGNVTNESKSTMFASPTFTGTVVLPNSTVTNAMLAGSIAYSKLSLTGTILNADLAGSIAYSKLSLTGAVLNADLAGSIAYSKLSLTGAVLNADLAGSIAASKLVGTDIATLGLNTSYNGVTSVSNGLSQIVAQINATAQAANIATATLYTVPASAGFYRISIYITITQAATTSSTMPSTTITYTDGNSGSNTHSTTTTATSAGNSVTTTFAQTTYILYAKASTNIQYATGSYASSGGTALNYALRIRVEAL